MGYFEIPALSNSGMSALNPDQNGSPKRFKNNDKSEQVYDLSLDRGSLLHLAVLEPDKFITQEVDRPSGMMGTFIEYYRTLMKGFEQEGGTVMVMGSTAHDVLVLKAAELSGYKIPWTTVWKNFMKDPENIAYYDFLEKTTPDKLPVSKSTRLILDNCISNLRAHPIANGLLFEQQDLIQTWNELEVFWVEKVEIVDENGFDIEVDVPCKAKIDRLRYHEASQRFQNVDLKTTSQGLGNFHKSYRDYRYYRQNAFYDRAVLHLALQNGIPHRGCTHLNVVVETIGLSEVGVYKSSDAWLSKGTAEYEAILKRYAWHSHHNRWEHPIEYYHTGGLLTLPEPV